MSKSPWFFCGKCGFQNHPRGDQADNTKCEQCGASSEDVDAKEYEPRA